MEIPSPAKDSSLDRFAAAWRGPAAPRLEDYLPPADAPDRLQVLAELVRIDLEQRRQRGETITGEVYLKKFPELSQAPPESTVVRTGVTSADTGTWIRPTPIVAGQRLGAYELLERLGGGGMGVVFRARHVDLGKQFALKVLQPGLAEQPQTRERFRREIQAAGQLEHTHLVQAAYAGEADGMLYLVMELLDGSNLEKLTQQRSWTVADACEAVRQAALGLQHAHERGLVHRDVKPSNLMLTRAGIVKVLDLGLARLCLEQGSPLTSVAQGMGTPDYMAPEQWDDSHGVDIRADVYSLGCTLYHLLAGRPPFGDEAHATTGRKCSAHLHEQPPPLNHLRSDVPQALADLVTRMLAKLPEDRPATPGEVARELEPFARGSQLDRMLTADSAPSVVAPTLPPPVRPLAAPPRPPRVHRHRWLLILGGLLATAATAVVLLVLTLHRHPSTTQPVLKGDDSQKVTPAPPARVEIERLHVVSYQRGQGGKLVEEGVLGASGAMLPAGAGIQLRARLSQPGYCYLLALRPDGSTALLLPTKDDQPPVKSARLVYPADDVEVLKKEGDHGFVLVASAQPLPAYREWRKSHDKLPWWRSEAKTAWQRLHGKLEPLVASRAFTKSIESSPAEKLDEFLSAWPEDSAFVVFPVVKGQ